MTLFATNPLGLTAAYLQHVQDLNWPVAEETLIRHTIRLLHHRAEGTQPG